jgi:capsular polysaccharide biosynthesis protein
MGRAIPLTNSQICRYATGNPWNQPLGRLADFLVEFTISPITYCLSGPSRLVSLIGVEAHSRVVHETTPFLRLGTEARLRLCARSCLPASATIDSDLCSLMDFRGWHSLYYHWFLDCLPRILAAEHHQQLTGRPCTLLVPDPLTPWQKESLHRLGYGGGERILRYASQCHANIRTPGLIAFSSHRHQHATEAPFDALSPATIRQLVTRLCSSTDTTSDKDSPRRIFITRNQATSRRLINSEAISSHLSSRGFTSIDLEGLSLSKQIALFRNASHVIAVHGAALTNLLYCQHASVLEIFAQQHGIRPDYFQIASINGLNYCHHVCPSLNDSNDIELDPVVLDAFLDASR